MVGDTRKRNVILGFGAKIQARVGRRLQDHERNGDLTFIGEHFDRRTIDQNPQAEILTVQFERSFHRIDA